MVQGEQKFHSAGEIDAETAVHPLPQSTCFSISLPFA
jgi:hypothetical protein